MNIIRLYCSMTAALLASCALAVLAQNPTPLVTQSAEKSIAVLKSDAGEKEKADACRELGVIGGKDAVAALVALLPDEKLSHMARYGLETIPDPAVDAAFRDQLGRLKGRLLVGVIGSIGVRRDAQAVDPLDDLLANTDPEVAQAAARALGKIGTPAAAQAIMSATAQTSEGNLVAFCEGLARCAEALVAAGRREEALAIYDRYTEGQLPQQVRAAGLRGAILTRGKDGLPLLRAALDSPDYILFAAAVRTAQEMKGSDVTVVLVEAMKGAVADRQIVLLQTLGLRADPTALPAMTALARSGGQPVRLAAVRALPMVGNGGSVTVLSGLLWDADGAVAAAARESLAGFPGPEADAAAVLLSGDADPKKQLVGIDLIGRRRVTGELPALLKLAASGPESVRPAALRQVGELGAATDLPAVLALLGGANGEGNIDAAAQAAILLSAKAGDPAASAARVTEAMIKSTPGQKQALLRVLGAIGGPDALRALRVAVDDNDPKVRSAAIRMLGSWKTADAAPTLLDVARTAKDPADQVIGLQSYLLLAADTDLPADQRLAMCKQVGTLVQRVEEKKLLLSALGGTKLSGALAVIALYLRDAGTRDEAGVAVVTIAEAILKGPDAARLAANLIGPLKMVADGTGNPDLAKRANKQLENAQAKAK